MIVLAYLWSWHTKFHAAKLTAKKGNTGEGQRQEHAYNFLDIKGVVRKEFILEAQTVN
jgi:hypothetical protein